MSNGSSRCTVYRVEARTSYPTPQQHCGMALGNAWQPVDFSRAPDGIGVPAGNGWSGFDRRGYLTYEAAQALRWWFIAQGGFASSLCLETRLVAYEYEETFTVKELGVEAAQPMARRPWDNFKPRDSDGSGEAGETRSGSTEGDSAVAQPIAQTPSPSSDTPNAK